MSFINTLFYGNAFKSFERRSVARFSGGKKQKNFVNVIFITISSLKNCGAPGKYPRGVPRNFSRGDFFFSYIFDFWEGSKKYSHTNFNLEEGSGPHRTHPPAWLRPCITHDPSQLHPCINVIIL